MNDAVANIDDQVQARTACQVETYLTEFLAQRSLTPALFAAIDYVVSSPGKRLRPVLVVHCCQAVGGNTDQALAPAAAVELIHNFSLVHDDLPAMDDDDLRRGKPTLHKHTNEAMAMLAGDAMTSLAFELLADRVLPRQRAGELCAELARATTDMIAGQVLDMTTHSEDALTPMQRLESIHRHKTAALIRCACRMGAIVGNANGDQLKAITDFGQSIGLMFQIVDDLLDVTGSTEQVGKATRKDAGQGKLTYPGLIGIDASRAKVQELHAQAVQALDGLVESGPLRRLCQYMAARLS
jgi:geranylgeranyl diphosphate synthase type II